MNGQTSTKRHFECWFFNSFQTVMLNESAESKLTCSYTAFVRGISLITLIQLCLVDTMNDARSTDVCVYSPATMVCNSNRLLIVCLYRFPPFVRLFFVFLHFLQQNKLIWQITFTIVFIYKTQLAMTTKKTAQFYYCSVHIRLFIL